MEGIAIKSYRKSISYTTNFYKLMQFNQLTFKTHVYLWISGHILLNSTVLLTK